MDSSDNILYCIEQLQALRSIFTSLYSLRAVAGWVFPAKVSLSVNTMKTSAAVCVFWAHIIGREQSVVPIGILEEKSIYMEHITTEVSKPWKKSFLGKLRGLLYSEASLLNNSAFVQFTSVLPIYLFFLN